MKKNEIKAWLMDRRTAENEVAVNYLLGLLDSMSDEDLHAKFNELKIDDNNIEQFLISQIERIQTQHEQSERFTNVNKMFCYGRIENTLHMHLIPKDLRSLKAKLGDEAFYQFFKDQLEDFLSRLQDIFKKDSTITTLFAVSPIFFNHNIAMAHEQLGFMPITQIDLENDQDGMSVEQKKRFLNMFNKDGSHKRNVYYTSMSREKLLGTEYARIPEDERTALDD
ncbi:MAG: hypothetical protein IKP28_04675 [Clostridia bacterium]|nr:hypothetical protein [Clostridia bacterium]